MRPTVENALCFLLGAAIVSPGIIVVGQKLFRVETRLEAIRTGIREGASFPRPINCAPFQGAPWEGHVLLGDSWPKDESRPQVCHLKSEVERLGLIPKVEARTTALAQLDDLQKRTQQSLEQSQRPEIIVW